MSKFLRADILALVGFVLEVGAVVALWFCYMLRHYIDVAVMLLVVSGCFFSLGIVAILNASLALGGSTPELNQGVQPSADSMPRETGVDQKTA